jgi:hypothetical protein
LAGRAIQIGEVRLATILDVNLVGLIRVDASSELSRPAPIRQVLTHNPVGHRRAVSGADARPATDTFLGAIEPFSLAAL